MQNAEGGAHRRGHADGGSTANDHFADGFGNFAVVGVGVGDFLGGKAALVEDDDAAFGPFNGFGYIHAFTVLASSGSFHCNGGTKRKRIVQWPGGIWVKPLVPAMEAIAI